MRQCCMLQLCKANETKKQCLQTTTVFKCSACLFHTPCTAEAYSDDACQSVLFQHQQNSLRCVAYLEMVDEAIIPNLNIHSQVFVTLNFLSAQDELQSFVNACVFAFSRRCKLFLAVHTHFAGSAEHRVKRLCVWRLLAQNSTSNSSSSSSSSSSSNVDNSYTSLHANR